MARVAYTDLFLSFDSTVDGITPDETQLASLITMLYKKAYTLTRQTYSADDSSDTRNMVATDDMFAIIQSSASRIAQQWYDSGFVQGAQDVNKMPIFDFNDIEKEQINMLFVEDEQKTLYIFNNTK